MSVGPVIEIPTENSRVETSKRWASWSNTTCCHAVASRPPYSDGHVIAPHPSAARAACHALLLAV